MKSAAVVLSLALAAPFAALAADIFLWTDESGRTHLTDSVPAKYRKSALRIDSRQFELSPEQQRDAAAARAALERQASAAAASASQAAAAAPPAPPQRAPASAAGDECEALQREYRESLDCFAPYVNANGSLKPGALAACKSVVNPTLKCGSPKSY